MGGSLNQRVRACGFLHSGSDIGEFVRSAAVGCMCVCVGRLRSSQHSLAWDDLGHGQLELPVQA